MNYIMPEIKHKIIYVIKAVIPDAKVFLYGSQARNDAKSKSDIDIAIQSKNKISRFDIGEIKDMLDASNILNSIDIVDLDSVDEEFKNEISKEMIEWTS